jgi:hypothetical protein
VDDIARARLDVEDKLHLKAADTLHRELLQELDRCVPPDNIPPHPPSLLIMVCALRAKIPARRASSGRRAGAGRSRVRLWDTRARRESLAALSGRRYSRWWRQWWYVCPLSSVPFLPLRGGVDGSDCIAFFFSPPFFFD